MEIKEKEVPEMKVAYIFHTGTPENMPELIGKVAEWVIGKGLQIVGPPFGIYYNSPAEVGMENMQYDVGFAVSGDAESEEEVKIKNIPPRTVLYAIHKGPYHEVPPVYTGLYEYSVKNGYAMMGAPMEIYLNDPMEVQESELLTEIQFPVQKIE
ncbi:MAG: GyrI-like domain-containing protein [Methanobacteriaceae archaeon]|nr:GyrI-like domain-containing protein [Methanobacteriaceae archaeon]